MSLLKSIKQQLGPAAAAGGVPVGVCIAQDQS